MDLSWVGVGGSKVCFSGDAFSGVGASNNPAFSSPTADPLLTLFDVVLILSDAVC